jgi:hypothetical protein
MVMSNSLVCNSLFFFKTLSNGIRGRSLMRTLSMFNSTVIGTDFVSFTTLTGLIYFVSLAVSILGLEFFFAIISLPM